MRFFQFFNWKWKIWNKETYDFLIEKLIQALWKPWNQFCQTCSANQGSQRSQKFQIAYFQGILLKLGPVHFFNIRNWYQTHFGCFSWFQGTKRGFEIFSYNLYKGKLWSHQAIISLPKVHLRSYMRCLGGLVWSQFFLIQRYSWKSQNPS